MYMSKGLKGKWKDSKRTNSNATQYSRDNIYENKSVIMAISYLY